MGLTSAPRRACGLTLKVSLAYLPLVISSLVLPWRKKRCTNQVWSSSPWRASSRRGDALDKTQAIEQLWRVYFADPHQWWDNRLQKALFDFLAKTIIHFISKEASLGFECLNLNQQRDIGFTFSFPIHQTKVNHGALVAWTKGFKITDSVGEDVVEQLLTALAEMGSAHAQVVCLLDSGSPDFKHKVTKKALWIDGCYTPAWVKVRFDKLQSDVGYRSRDSQGTAQPNRHGGEGGGWSMHMQTANTTNEAIAILNCETVEP